MFLNLLAFFWFSCPLLCPHEIITYFCSFVHESSSEEESALEEGAEDFLLPREPFPIIVLDWVEFTSVFKAPFDGTPTLRSHICAKF
jgi:hypothetical protein